MKYTCLVVIEDDIEADNEEEAKEKFLEMVHELGVKWYCRPKDVKIIRENK